MLVLVNPSSSKQDLARLLKLLGEMGADHCVIETSRQTLVEVLGSLDHVDRVVLEDSPAVERIVDRPRPALAEDRKEGSATRRVPLGSANTVGGDDLAIIAGPCSVESRSQLFEIAAAVREAGAVGLRGGAFKPRTSPYSFQGLGEGGLELLALAREATGLAIVTEVMCCEQVDVVSRYADMLQIGSRSMHNTHLLRAVGRQSKPVLLKRGWSATFQEFLLAAEYILQEGNENVVLCERGIRTHETFNRNTLSLSVVPEVKRVSTLPIIVDPSHGTGRRHLVPPMSNAAIACGADGLLIEVHGQPDLAWSDADQTISIREFRELMRSLAPFAGVAGRRLEAGVPVPD